MDRRGFPIENSGTLSPKNPVMMIYYWGGNINSHHPPVNGQLDSGVDARQQGLLVQSRLQFASEQLLEQKQAAVPLRRDSTTEVGTRLPVLSAFLGWAGDIDYLSRLGKCLFPFHAA